MKNKLGRPTKYNSAVIDQVGEYIKHTGSEQMRLPTREGFAHFVGVHRDTIDEWDKEYPDFSDAIKAIDELQKMQLMNDGLYGGKEVNSTMAIFLLKANHGMIEQSNLTINQSGTITIELVRHVTNENTIQQLQSK